jgi:TPR repeat protein
MERKPFNPRSDVRVVHLADCPHAKEPCDQYDLTALKGFVDHWDAMQRLEKVYKQIASCGKCLGAVAGYPTWGLEDKGPVSTDIKEPDETDMPPPPCPTNSGLGNNPPPQNLLAQANAGDAKACYDIAGWYEKQGDEVRKFEWNHKAAILGHKHAKFIVAFYYLEGIGTKQNLAASAIWHKKSAQGGFDVAQYNLGLMYIRGTGVTHNPHKAKYWLELAAQQGNEDAIKYLKDNAEAFKKSSDPNYRPTKSDEPVGIKKLKWRLF